MTAHPAQLPVDATQVREAFRRFPTGVAVVTADDDGEVSGMTVNSLTMVCLEPPTLLVCLHRAARTTAGVHRSGRFAVSVLAESQAPVAVAFAVPGVPRPDLPRQAQGPPVVPDAIVQLQCFVTDWKEVGDHAVVFGLISSLVTRPGAPLGFLEQRLGGTRIRSD